jgi:hypothetical protein
MMPCSKKIFFFNIFPKKVGEGGGGGGKDDEKKKPKKFFSDIHELN